MNRHALVIGSETNGLAGAIHDATCMAKLLEARELRVLRRIGKDATRDGILDGYKELTGKLGVGDAAVVYYAGHGSFTFNADPGDSIRTVQAILPVDHVPGGEQFHAITAWELSILLNRLTDRTRNVTTIFDCCHSAQMNRDGAARLAVPRALPHPLRTSFREHLAALDRLYGKVELDPVADRHAVRLVACAQSESAWEYTDANGTRTGVFTEALIEVLNQVGSAAISWAAVVDAVRERVLRRFEWQRPDVEGPSERRLFTEQPDERTGAVAVTARDGVLRIHTGEIFGTTEGDVYAAMPLGATSYDAAKVIASLEVTEVQPLESTVTPAWKNGHAALPDDAVAIPVELRAPAHPVIVIAPDAEHRAITAALGVARTLTVIGPGEAGALATLRLVDNQLAIEDAAGPIFPPARYPDELAETVKNLANLGVARRVRDMVGEHGLSAQGLDISWGVVESGQQRPMPDHGASLGLGDRIYVKVQNTGSEPRYIHIFNVGVRGKVTLLTRNLAPAGYKLDNSNPELVLGQRNATFAGLPLGWPKGLPEQSFPRTDSVFVFATARPVGLHHLETQDYVARGGRRVAGSRLQRLLAQVQDGLPSDVRTREIGDDDPLEGFLVRHLSYQLHPRKAAMANTVTFQIDENPHQHGAGRNPDAWITGGDSTAQATIVPAARAANTSAAVPHAIAIRLGELVVGQTRALPVADIRIDALVCTRSANQHETYTARTLRFSAIEAGQHLKLGNDPIFKGPVRDFADLHLWVSHDVPRRGDLADLLAASAVRPDVHDAITALRSTTDLAVPWITAVGASAALARIAHDLIVAIPPETVGLYRTFLLASERFGAGRHPAESLYRAQDFSFSLLIEPVPAAV